MTTKTPIDWEEAMTQTRDSAEAAARMSERAVSGVARLLDTQHRHSQRLNDLTKAVEAIRRDQGNRPSSSPPEPAARPQCRRPPPLWPALIGTFVVGVLFGVSIGNW